MTQANGDGGNGNGSSTLEIEMVNVVAAALFGCLPQTEERGRH
jgi:hypothetical protein